MKVLENPLTLVNIGATVADGKISQIANDKSIVILERERSHVRLEKVCLNFQVSLNEEHTFLSISYGNEQQIDLGERAHHYCLLTLARQRLEDAKNGLDPSSQGWLELGPLSKLLGLEPEHLNIQIFRARTQLINALPQLTHLPGVIERRRGELRFGAHQFRIVRGSQLEGKYSPADEMVFA
jgi:hypothetical protein